MGVIRMFDLHMEMMSQMLKAGPQPRPTPHGWRTVTVDPLTSSGAIAQALRDRGFVFRSTTRIACLYCNPGKPSAEVVLGNGKYAYQCFTCGARRDVHQIRAELAAMSAATGAPPESPRHNHNPELMPKPDGV